jgi:hypothetical protein
MSQECVPWSANVIAAENSKNSARHRFLDLSSHSPALSSPRQANVPLLTRHSLPFQASHPAIENPPNSLKTFNEIFSNRHTHAHSSIHVPHPAPRGEGCGCQQRRSKSRASLRASGVIPGGQPQHPGIGQWVKPMKINTRNYFNRNTSASSVVPISGLCSQFLKRNLEGEEKALAHARLLAEAANRYTRKLKIR